jgi:bifunctional DNase/RNase
MLTTVGRTAGHAPVIFLKMLDGSDRVLPVFIGEAECAALLKEIRNQPSLRPMTHDLMKSSLQAVGVTVTRVQVCHGSHLRGPVLPPPLTEK